ncbi:MAG: hypothetical protein H5T69_12200 [Chloroflexi bacterium]|nr:hypothetical protein [Chloroflexota bacterium]
MLRAPFDGAIAYPGAKAGEQATPGQFIATVRQTGDWIIETDDLTEMEVAHIKPASVDQHLRWGMKVIVTFRE